MNYWARKNELMKKAQAHTEEMQKRYPIQILQCVQDTKTFAGKVSVNPKHNRTPVIKVIDADSVSAAFSEQLGNTCILNYASYKHPGGMFINGSSAQEECLCHESFLYNVLKEKVSYYMWNKDNTNYALYKNRALYSPKVIFEHNGQKEEFDVLTCAAPNYHTAKTYDKISKEMNSNTMRSRINFIINIMNKMEVDTAILGAWGCGVFEQDPEEVATMFKEAIDNGLSDAEQIIFAIPAGPNLDAFRKIFE